MHEAVSVGPGHRVGDPIEQTPFQSAETAVRTPAGAGFEVAESAPRLADGETQGVAVAVGLDPQEILSGA